MYNSEKKVIQFMSWTIPYIVHSMFELDSSTFNICSSGSAHFSCSLGMCKCKEENMITFVLLFLTYTWESSNAGGD